MLFKMLPGCTTCLSSSCGLSSRSQVGLKLYTLEDATFGYWLQPWDISHVNHTRFRSASLLAELGFEANHTEHRASQPAGKVAQPSYRQPLHLHAAQG